MRGTFKTREQIRTCLQSWHEWFAWYPVFWEGRWAWLETIERRGTVQVYPHSTTDGWNWEYRFANRLVIK